MSANFKTKRPRGIRRRYALYLLLLLFPSTQALAQLMLYPTRIVFEGNQRSAQLELINNGTDSATYRISLVNRRMGEAGGFSEIEEALPGEQFAEDLLRYSPRQVTLAPGAGQTVRIMVRKPANLAEGEYRSHLLFSQQPDARGRNSVESRNSGSDNEIGVRVTALVGTAIPVIVRHGNTEADVSLTHLEVKRSDGKASVLAFDMERGGNQSVYGDLTVSYTAKNGAEHVIGRANGVAVYTPNPLRRASIPLKQMENAQLSDGTLRVTYREQAEDGGKLLAEAVLQLP